MDKQKDFEKGWEEYKAKKKQEIEEMIGIIQNAVGGCAEHWAKLIAEELHKNRYRKIPENAVLTDNELNEELDTIKCVMIVHDDDGERYVSYDDYKEFTDRLGKIARQRKVKIEQLENLLDNRCDHCIERERKETAEKFAETLKLKVKKLELGGWIEVATGSMYKIVDEIAKEITEGDNVDKRRKN